MSILVKGVKMPRCCEVCPFNYDYYRCEALGDRFDDREEIDMETQRLSNCPLVEIPPHGRLIDASEMAIKFNCLDIDITTVKKLHELLMEIPTVIESEAQDHE